VAGDSTPGVEADPASLSPDTSDKLQAVVSHGWEGASTNLLKEYLDACTPGARKQPRCSWRESSRQHRGIRCRQRAA
jgi:hypothetical protein